MKKALIQKVQNEILGNIKTVIKSSLYNKIILNASKQFHPNYFEDISNFLSKKIKALKIYKSEMGKFPFPRSKAAIDAQAKWRGTYIGSKAAEAFELLRQII